MRAVAWPPEHGGWGVLLEALLMGLIAAPSRAAMPLALAAAGGFLARHPLKLVLSDARRGRMFPRTRWALAFLGLYGGILLIGLVLAAALSRGPFWLPLALAMPPAVAQLAYDSAGRGRKAAAEALGAAVPGAIASSMALASGWGIAPALALWVILAARSLSAILYVRALLRRDRGSPPSILLPIAGHAASFLLVVCLAAAGLAPWVAAAVFSVLLARALVGLSGAERPVRAQALGLREMLLGAAAALLIGAGYRLGT